MKRQGLISILACLLLSMGSPHTMYGGFGARVIEEGSEVASKAAMESATKSIEKAGMTATKEMTESLAKSMDKAAADLMESSALKDSSAIMKSLESSATKELESFGKDAAKAEEHLAKNSDQLAISMTKDVQGKSVTDLVESGMKESDAKMLKQSEAQSKEVLEDIGKHEPGDDEFHDAHQGPQSEAGQVEIKEPTSSQYKPKNPAEESELKGMSNAEKQSFDRLKPEDQAEYFKKTPSEKEKFSKNADAEAAKTNKLSEAGEAEFKKMTPEEQTKFLSENTEKQVEEFSAKADKAALKEEESHFFKKDGFFKKVYNNDVSYADARLAAKSGAGKIMGVVDVIGMAVLFMIPSIFESAFLAEEQKNALLMTYSTPIEFGNIVLQMPDSAINVEDPAQMTEFYYYGIPVDAVGSPLSKSAAAQYSGVTGPDHNNSVSKSITNGYAKAFSLGTAKTTPPPARYNLNVDALSKLPIFVSGVSESYEKWGSAAINSPYFEQMLVNLDTGYVFYADGLADGTPAAPLVGSAETKSVESYLSTKMGQLQTQGSASSYTEYTNTFSSSKANSTSSAITNRFNCGCLQKSKVLSADTIKTCKNSKTCLLVPALESLAAGLIINADGKQLTKDQDLTAEIAKGALGQVTPIQGLGDDFADYLSFFPGAVQSTISSADLTVSYGFADSDGSYTKAKPVGAEPDNYAAKGLYIYQSKNTPLARMLRSQAGGSVTTAYNDHITDYIVFFDHELNLVPLMVPMEDPNNYNFPTMQMNPEIVYWSTIIGNISNSQGQISFSYLPQLMVVPGKGQPAIVPLYGLNAKPVENTKPQQYAFQLYGNSSLENKISGIIQDFASTHKDLYIQFTDIINPMIDLLLKGPFGKYNLRPLDTLTPEEFVKQVPSYATKDTATIQTLLNSIEPVLGGIKMPVYTGYNTYPVAQDARELNYNDILIPIDAAGKTAVLPSSSIVGYYGIVSDISYSVASDGSLYFTSTAFNNSCFSQSLDSKVWTINPAKQNTYYWLDQRLPSMNAGKPMSQQFIDYVHTARANWIAWITNQNKSTTSNAEFAGITWTGSAPNKVLKIVDQQALSNSLYVYTCMANPSKLAQDFFVLTNSANPLAIDKTLGTMSASAATSTTNMLSLVSGILYDATGTPVKNNGVTYQVDAMDAVNSLYAANKKAFSDSFTNAIVNACNNYKKAESAFVYPFSFYTFKLGMYQADIDLTCYLYADAAGAGTSTAFKPQDYFVTYDDAKGVSLNQQISTDSSQCMVSLVSGVVYNKNGAVHTLSDASLTSLYTSVSKLLRKDLKADIDAARKAFTKPSDPVVTTPETAGITWKKDQVAAKIAAVASQPYVPAPYVMLKYEPTSKQYVQVSPASTDGTEYIYTFFDVPYADGAGNTTYVGAMFDSAGNLQYYFGDLQIESALIQNGICITSHGGPQQLGVPALQPIMLLDKADFSLKPGATGASMIHADSQDFPTLSTITSPVTMGKSSFYFYYNTIMQAYYVMEVNGKDIRYISMAGGNIYNQDGSLRPLTNPVALRNGTDVTDVFLPYLNQNGYTQAVMLNSLDNKNMYQNFLNVESSFDGNVKLDSKPVASNILSAMAYPYTQVTVVQSPRIGTIPPMPDIHDATQYNVYWDVNNPSMYKVDASYSWQALSLLPVAIDKDRSLMSSKPAQSMRNAGIILKNGVVERLVFANNLYVGSLGSEMKAVGNTTAPRVTLTLKKDPKTYVKDLTTGKDDQSTGISYYEVKVTGGSTYNYSLVFDQLSDDQLTSYQYNAWKSETVADVKGGIILAQFLPTSGSGSLQLDNFGIKEIGNPPSDAAAQATLTKSLTRIKVDKVHGRFIAQVFASDSSQITKAENKDKQSTYLSQDGYVDLETGALFDTKGVPRGIALSMTDLNSLTTKLTVAVSRPSVVDKDGAIVLNKMGKPVMSKDATLIYKAPFVPRFARASTSTASTTSTTASQAQAGVLGRLSSAPDTATLPEVVKEVKEQTQLSPEEKIVLNLKNRLDILHTLDSTSEVEALKNEIKADLKKFELYGAKSELNKLRALNDKFEQIEKEQAENIKKGSMQPKEGATKPQVPVQEDTEGSKLVEPVVVPALTQAQQLQNELSQLHTRKSDADLQKQVNKLKVSLPKTDQEQIERLEKQNQQLQAAIDVLTKDIVKTSKGKQNDYVKRLLQNKRDTIAKHQTLINNNSSKINVLRDQNAVQNSTSRAQAGVLGRLGSHQTEEISTGFFSWVNSVWSQVGSLFVSN